MNSKIVPSIFGCALLVTLLTSAAMAQVQRTFVSGLGVDSNPCSRTAPCRNFAQAISQTNPRGEVVVLDSAGYGAFVINKSVSIIAPPGIYAGISVFSGDGIDINAGFLYTVLLRGLTVTNQGSSGSGIVFNTGNRLRVESCVVSGFFGLGARGLSFNAAGGLEVKDSIMRDNSFGILVGPSSGFAVAEIDQVRLEGNGTGLLVVAPVVGSSFVTVSNSVASDNFGTGFYAQSETGTNTFADLNIENCVASNNQYGIVSQSTSSGVATVRVSNSTVTANGFLQAGVGIANFGAPAVILSRGNNTVEGNLTNTTGTIGSYSAK